MEKLNILLIGGTGFVGGALSKALLAAGHKISVLSRSPASDSILQNGTTHIQADVSKPGLWQDKIPDFQVVLNLTGASIFRRWTMRGKQLILDSRVLTTRNIVEAIVKRKGNIEQFFSMSGVGYYGFHGDEILKENSTAGSDFLAQVAARWEEAAEQVKDLGIRPVILRLGHVLGSGGGILPKLSTLADLHLASRWGSGEQWISWIQIDDLARAFLFLLDNQSIRGPVNITSPNPVRNREIMEKLAGIRGEGVFIPPIPRFSLQIMLGEFSTAFLNGQRVLPHILTMNGFFFKYPNLDQALIDLVKYKAK